MTERSGEVRTAAGRRYRGIATLALGRLGAIAKDSTVASLRNARVVAQRGFDDGWSAIADVDREAESAPSAGLPAEALREALLGLAWNEPDGPCWDSHPPSGRFTGPHGAACTTARAALAAAPEAGLPDGLDVETLTDVLTSIDTGTFWREEPRQLNDPPHMQRMTFDHADYAAAILRRLRASEPSDR